MTSPQRCIAHATFVSLICLSTVAARAQDTSTATAASQSPSWIIPDLAAAARAEGALTVYSSMNEQEGLPLWKMFEDAAGVKVNYVRSSDSIILSRIAIESRGRQRSWDLAVTTTVNRLPNETLLQFDPPQARGLIAQARPTAAGTGSTRITTRPLTTPTWSSHRNCRRVTRNSSTAGSGPARSPSTIPMTNG